MDFGNPIERILAKENCVVLDGALATLLEARGCDISSSLWSCEALLSSPDLIRQVHLDYFIAGANVAITASYQASLLGLAEHKGMSGSEASELIKTSVKLAQEARQQAAAEAGRNKEDMLIAGSVGPYGAYLADGSEYRGDYDAKVTKDTLKTFHRPRIAALLDAGADLLACETLPSMVEIEALCELLNEEFPQAWAWFSFTARDAEHLSDETGWGAVCGIIEKCERVVALGVNCVPRDDTASILGALRRLTSLPLVAYPNSGETWDADRREWQDSIDTSRGGDDGNSVSELIKCTKCWYDAGARLIGGCCRTGPHEIREIRTSLLELR